MTERVTLTEAEREALRDWWDTEPPECTTGMLARLDATVERILAARLAAVTADYERRLDHAHDNHLRLRAALLAEREAAVLEQAARSIELQAHEASGLLDTLGPTLSAARIGVYRHAFLHAARIIRNLIKERAQ